MNSRRAAWTELREAESADVWTRFARERHFRPSVQPTEWPGLAEPSPFVTWAVPDPWSESDLEDLHECALRAFRKALPPSAVMYALDWQHTSYRLSPHAEVEPWLVSAIPNGDYSIFLAPELGWGWFGHPWEQTICVFGAPLLAALVEAPPVLFTRALRRG